MTFCLLAGLCLHVWDQIQTCACVVVAGSAVQCLNPWRKQFGCLQVVPQMKCTTNQAGSERYMVPKCQMTGTQVEDKPLPFFTASLFSFLHQNKELQKVYIYFPLFCSFGVFRIFQCSVGLVYVYNVDIVGSDPSSAAVSVATVGGIGPRASVWWLPPLLLWAPVATHVYLVKGSLTEVYLLAWI